MAQADFEGLLRSQIAELEERQAQLSTELMRVEGHLAGLRQALSLYRGERQQPTSLVQPPVARGSRAPDPRKIEWWAFALGRMESAQPRGIQIDELHTAITSAGYETTRNTLRAHLSNAAKAGTIERVAYGRYRKQKHETDTPGAEHDESGQADETGDIASTTSEDMMS